jgi:hypothetical protein
VLRDSVIGSIYLTEVYLIARFDQRYQQVKNPFALFRCKKTFDILENKGFRLGTSYKGGEARN